MLTPHGGTGGAGAPIIVTALLGRADFAWADGLRRAHFPPERNLIPAHLTLFHHLPPSALAEVAARLKRLCAGPSPAARLTEVMLLGRGVAFRVESPDLMAMRDELADAFAGLLTPQDQARPRLHITVQNKVSPQEAKALVAQLRADFRSRPLTIAGLAAWHYRGGPWEPAMQAMFRG
ncbi:2'-5' RNA ligase superfamily protein [Sphingobium sp. AP50]|uniref:2'-5' RNA ligase family protein n=1 Tax=Sphingobium sp. AP50 TaxID=1884369 RepID=UPI0008D78358|nr:2'-5' RNA ligase family protein [Sphingobium sp. AP50]SEJ94455.1 2'-5' RNA ligase superfamily protein [Sphingobium sp. AP50]